MEGTMNAHTAATQFIVEIDPRAVLLARASAMDTLYLAGELDLCTGFDRMADAFLTVAGPDPGMCKHCGDPTWRHESSWCAAVRKVEAQRRNERTTIPRPTAESTIEAIMWSVRQRGIAALDEPANVERLSRCDERAKAETNNRIAKLNLQKETVS
jgi:hypothetical protein